MQVYSLRQKVLGSQRFTVEVLQKCAGTCTPSSQDEALAPYSVSREVPRSVLTLMLGGIGGRRRRGRQRMRWLDGITNSISLLGG